jgi:hypothetical protein
MASYLPRAGLIGVDGLPAVPLLLSGDVYRFLGDFLNRLIMALTKLSLSAR